MPEHLRQYDELVAGSAEKIIDTVYEAPERRQQQLTDAVVSDSRRGQSWAIFLAVVSIVSAIVFFALGNNIAGFAMLGLPLVTLIASFLPWRAKGD